MVRLLNQSHISQSPWDTRKDLLRQLHELITRRRDREIEQNVQGRKQIKSKEEKTNKRGKTLTMTERVKGRGKLVTEQRVY